MILKKIFLLLPYFILLSCNNKVNSQNNIETKIYYTQDSIEIFELRILKNQYLLQLKYNKNDKHKNYVKELSNSIHKAKVDGHNLDSIDLISMDFFQFNKEIVEEFSSILTIQKEMSEQIMNNRQFLNHDLIGRELSKSKFIKTILNLLNKETTNISFINVDKCRVINTQGTIPSNNQNKLICSYLHIHLK